MTIAAIILAGGTARRMGGGDKCLQILGGRPILDHVIERVRQQAESLALSANGDPTRFAPWSLPVLADEMGQGPLAGVLSGLRWVAAHHPRVSALLSVPADMPFLPRDLVERMSRPRQGADIITVAVVEDRRHWVVALWPTGIAASLERWFAAQEPLKVEAFIRQNGFAEEDFADKGALPFLNINSPSDLADATALWEANRAR